MPARSPRSRPAASRSSTRARDQGRLEHYGAYLADALDVLVADAEAAAGAGVDGRGHPPASVKLLVPIAALRAGPGPGEDAEVCEIPGVGPVPAATASALLGDATVKLLLEDGVDVRAVWHLGRTVTAAQRAALEARDPTCVVPGCTADRHLEIDHVTGWAITRTTRLDDLARLCRWHHHQKTHCGHVLIRNADGTWAWTPPGPPGPDPPGP